MRNLLLLLLGLVATVSGLSSRLTNVLRVNYGATFTYTGLIDNAAQRWVHTYMLNVPQFNMHSVRVADCSSSNPHCKQYLDLMNTIQSHRQRVFDEWNRLEEDIEFLFPKISLDTLKDRLQTRSVLPLGEFFKFLFGSATDADYDILKKNLKEVTDLIDVLAGEIDGQNSNLTSYSQLLRDEFDGMQQQLDQVHDILQSVTNQTDNMVKSMETMSREVSLALAYSSANSSEIINNLQTYRRGVLALSRGVLSPDLLSPKEMQKMISAVQEALKADHPRYHLPATTTRYFYNLKSFTVFRQGNQLYLNINFPVTDSSSLTKLYQVSAFPLLYDQNVSHATILEDLPAYFAEAEDGSGFLEITEAQMRSCKEVGGVFMCNQLIPKIAASRQTCTSAIFADNPEAVHELCRNSLLVDGLQSSMMELEPGLILMTNVPSGVAQCKDESTLLKPCTQCIVKLPCECSINSHGPYMPENMQTCRFRSEVLQLLHHTNLHVLMHFMNASTLGEMAGSMMLTEPLFIMPKTPVLSTALADHFAELREKNIRLPLGPVMEKVKKDTEIMTNAFQAKAAQIRERKGNLAWAHALLVLMLGMSVLATMLVGFVLAVVKQLHTYVLVVSS